MPADKRAGPVPEEALRFFRAKRLEPSFDFRDVWREEHRAAFTVAKITEHDLLNDVRQAVDEALEKGLTYRDFAKKMRPIMADKGWWGRKEKTDPITGEKKEVQLGSPQRLRTIYHTNLRTARAAGQWSRIQRRKRALPNLIYSEGPAIEHRPSHQAFVGTIRPVDDPFWDTHMVPNGYGCTHTVRQISNGETRRRGGVSAPPKTPPIPWRNKRTGKVEQVPYGVDPGFDYNPGKDRMAGINRALKDRGL